MAAWSGSKGAKTRAVAREIGVQKSDGWPSSERSKFQQIELLEPAFAVDGLDASHSRQVPA